MKLISPKVYLDIKNRVDHNTFIRESRLLDILYIRNKNINIPLSASQVVMLIRNIESKLGKHE